MATISTTFIDPLSPQPLMSISTGVVETDKVTNDMLSAKSVGKTTMNEFITNRLGAERTACIFDPIKKLKLGTFQSLNKVKKCKINSRSRVKPGYIDRLEDLEAPDTPT